MKSNKVLIGLLAVCMLASLACGMTDNLLNSAVNKAVGDEGTFTSTSTLWPDVPQMDGLTLSPLEDMPPFIKIAMRLILGNLGRLNGAGEDQKTGNVDWIAFTTDKTPQDVQNFYTNDLMTASGWDTNDTPCVSGSEQGSAQVGAACIYQKTENGQLIQLLIMTAQDDQTKQNNVFYLRLQSAATSQPTTAP